MIEDDNKGSQISVATSSSPPPPERLANNAVGVEEAELRSTPNQSVFWTLYYGAMYERERHAKWPFVKGMSLFRIHPVSISFLFLSPAVPRRGQKAVHSRPRLIYKYLCTETDKLSAKFADGAKTWPEWQQKRPAFIKNTSTCSGSGRLPENMPLKANDHRLSRGSWRRRRKYSFSIEAGTLRDGAIFIGR